MGKERILGSFFMKGRLKKGLHEEENIGWSIYKSGLSWKEHRKRYNFFHYIFKYKLFVPFLIFTKRVLKKYIEPVPMSPENKNLILFDEAVEKSLLDWTDGYLSEIGSMHGKKKTKKSVEQRAKGSSQNFIRWMKELVLAGAVNDGAYREFINILMFNITILMNKNHPAKAEHLFYMHRNVNNILYYAVQCTKEKGYHLKNIKLVTKKKGDKIEVKILTKGKNGKGKNK